MKLSRRASWLLIAFALWSWLIWVTLIKNLSADPRAWGSDGGGPTGFLMVHVALAAISLALGSAIGWLGWRGLRTLRQQAQERQTPESPAPVTPEREPLDATRP